MLMDLYAVLGLSSGASAADIKRSYRRLARRYHPGINPGDAAAVALFEQITEAYETLVDPIRRQRYDSAGTVVAGGERESFAFAGFDFSVAACGSQAATFTELFAEALHPVGAAEAGEPEVGADLHASLSIGFVDAVRGVQRQIVVARQEVCAACRGAGIVVSAEGQCAACEASGTVRWARGHMVFAKPCGACGGSGRRRHQHCDVCAAQGRVMRSDAVRVPVPPGIADGAALRLAGLGHGGRRGGPPGDLYVTIHVAAHPLFRRLGDDLLTTVPIALHEAVLGAPVDVPTLDGEVELRIPAGTQPGQQLRIPGHGVSRRGDLVVDVRVVVPAAIDERSRQLMREFGRRNSTTVRPQRRDASSDR